MIIHRRMPSLVLALKSRAINWAAISVVVLAFVGFTQSNPIVSDPSDGQAAPDSIIPMGYAPPALLAGRGYYGDSDEEATQVAKRNPHARLHEFEDESNLPSYVERRSELPESRYWNLLKALEEELALEAMSRQGPESDEPIVNEAAPESDAHKVNKRRRRYGFWVTAINKMGQRNLKGFLGKHKNIYNVYKRAPWASRDKWHTV